MRKTVLKREVRAWLTRWFGEKCKDFEPTCILCKKWKAFDDLFN